MQQPQPTLPFAPAIGFARNRETAPAYWMLDLLWLVLVDGHETGGAFSVMEQWMRQGSGPPIPHIHLSFPKIISARSDDAIRTRLVW
jgi:hypothetical protein